MKTPIFKKSVALVLFFPLFLFAQHVNAQWSQLNSGSSCNLTSIHFPHPDTGYVACQEDTVLKTDDKGNNWTPKPLLGFSSGTSSVYFTDVSTGYVTETFGGLIYKTVDGGNSWGLQGAFMDEIRSIHFPATDTGFAVGSSTTFLDPEWAVAKTTDGGASWSITTFGGSFAAFYGVYFTDVNTGYAVGSSGTIYKTTNGGVSWTQQTSGTFVQLRSVHFPSVDTGYVVGQLGTILKTTDGGTNWGSQTSGTGEFLFSVYFVNANTGYAVGDNGTILKTIDGGTTWFAELACGITEHFKSVYFTYPDTGYIVGDNGTILKRIVPDDNVGVIAIDAPPAGGVCGFTVSESVTIKVENFGAAAQSNIPVSYTVNGGAPVNETIVPVLNPGDTVSYTFTTTVDLSSPGSYTFDAWTGLVGDGNNCNDSLKNHPVYNGQLDSICIFDADGGSGDTTCSSFTDDWCNDGIVQGDMTLKTSDTFSLSTANVDSIVFYMYMVNWGINPPVDLTFYFNSDSVGAFTDNVSGFFGCDPPSYLRTVSITDSATLNNVYICFNNTVGVIHNGPSLRVSGFTAIVYSTCSSCGGCNDPDLPTLTATSSTICDGDSTTLSVSAGSLNSATSWQWYSGSCGGTPEGTGTSIVVSPTVTTTYYARGEGGCVTPGSCSNIAITVNPVYSTSDPGVAICNGDSVSIYSTFQSVAGTYYDGLTTVDGCDSVHSTVLTVNPTYSNVDAPQSICNADSVSIYGTFQLTAGTYYDSLTSVDGCDSVHSTVLTVNPTYNNVDAPQSICNADSVSIYGTFQLTAGTYYDSLTSVDGCDSVHSTVLTVNPTYNNVDAPQSICNGDSVSIYGTFQLTAGTYYDSLTSVDGCDSVHSTVLTLYPTYNITDPAIAICNGDSVSIYGTFISIAGTYYDSLTTVNSCDSIHSTVLTLNPIYNITDPAIAICNGDSVSIYGTFRSVAGTYYDSLTTANGCDSITTTTLIINPTYSINTPDDTICDGDSAMIFSVYRKIAGTYYDTLPTVDGCDSVIATTLIVNPLPVISVIPSPGIVCNYGDTVMLIASGAVSYTWSPATGLNTITGDTVLAFPLTDTIYTVTGINASGCVDSTTVSVQLSIAAPVANFTANTTNVCEGNTVTFNNTSTDATGFSWSFPGGTTTDTTVQNPVVTYNTAGVFDVTLTALGCSIDSTITLTGYITVNSIYTITTPDETICDGDSVSIFAVYRKIAGTYYDSSTTVNGCDSITTTTLIVNPTYSINTPDETICDGDSVSIFSVYRKTAGIYYDSSTTINGCDSVIATTLIVNSLPTVNLGADTTICNGCSITLNAGTGFTSYDWSTGEITQTINVNSTDTYIVTVTDANSCMGSDTIVVDIASGLNELSSVENISIYPNPNTGEFVIEMNVLKIQDVEITLVNITGQVIYSENLKRFKGVYLKRIDIKGLSTGVYQLQIRTGYGEINKKVVVE